MERIIIYTLDLDSIKVILFSTRWDKNFLLKGIAGKNRAVSRRALFLVVSCLLFRIRVDSGISLVVAVALY